MKKSIICVLMVLFCGAIASASLGEWLLNDGSGTTAADSSGNGADLSLAYGSPDWLVDHPQYGTGFSFSSSQRFSAAEPVGGFAFDMSQDFMLSMTISVNPAVSSAVLMGRYNDEDWSYGEKTFGFYQGKLNWQCHSVGSVLGTANVADGQFHDIAVEFDADTGTINMYVDGQLDGSSSAFGNMALIADNYDFHLGSHIFLNGEALYQPYFGIMSDVVITPEPATMLLLGAGAALLRRKK